MCAQEFFWAHGIGFVMQYVCWRPLYKCVCESMSACLYALEWNCVKNCVHSAMFTEVSTLLEQTSDFVAHSTRKNVNFYHAIISIKVYASVFLSSFSFFSFRFVLFILLHCYFHIALPCRVHATFLFTLVFFRQLLLHFNVTSFACLPADMHAFVVALTLFLMLWLALSFGPSFSLFCHSFFIFRNCFAH